MIMIMNDDGTVYADDTVYDDKIYQCINKYCNK